MVVASLRGDCCARNRISPGSIFFFSILSTTMFSYKYYNRIYFLFFFPSCLRTRPQLRADCRSTILGVERRQHRKNAQV